MTYVYQTWEKATDLF